MTISDTNRDGATLGQVVLLLFSKCYVIHVVNVQVSITLVHGYVGIVL